MLEECPHCHTRVLRMADGRCPACHGNPDVIPAEQRDLRSLRVRFDEPLPPSCMRCGAPTRRTVRVLAYPGRFVDARR